MPTEKELITAKVRFDADQDLPKLYRAAGCAACGNTGYKGRLALHEVMTVTEEVERLTVENASSDTIKKVAIDQGMRTLREDGMEKVLMGSTSIEEILRVVV